MNSILKGVASLCTLVLPVCTYAHEVYVLDTASITTAMQATSPNPFAAIAGNEGLFIFWGFVSFVVFSTVIAASVFGVFEKKLSPLLFAAKKYALPIARITTGLSVIAFAASGHVFATELWLSTMFGSATQLAQMVLITCGLMLVLGVYTRYAAYVLLGLYVWAGYTFGVYVLTYTDFLGAFALLAMLGAGIWSIDSVYNLHGHEPKALSRLHARLSPYAFPFLRICFGWGVLFASVYAKFMYSELAYQVVVQYDLTRFFPFDPLFVVLGALIIEFLAGLMLIFGVAVRWTLVFLAFWLTLSLLYFQELIWPHGILFGLAIALFLHGYDKYTLEGYFFKKGTHEPVF